MGEEFVKLSRLFPRIFVKHSEKDGLRASKRPLAKSYGKKYNEKRKLCAVTELQYSTGETEMKKSLIAIGALLCLLTGCASRMTEIPTPVKTDTPPAAAKQDTEIKTLEELTMNAIQATITMEDGGVISLDLYYELAPQSVRNFVYLARSGFYDGLKFHRIMEGFMIQGGDPNGTGTGGPGYCIKGEFKKNGVSNDLKHERGVLSMARSDANDSAGSQFFIMHADYFDLDGLYAAFGRVTGGMDVVDKLAKTPNSGSNGAVAEENKPVIKTVTIDSDMELPEPEMLK